MSKHLTLLVLMGAALLPVAAASSVEAQESPQPDPRILCPWMVSEGYFRSQGDCVQGFRVGSAATCQQMEPNMLEYLGYRSRGECVAKMRRLERDRD
jgi:hypothetical protein